MWFSIVIHSYVNVYQRVYNPFLDTTIQDCSKHWTSWHPIYRGGLLAWKHQAGCWLCLSICWHKKETCTGSMSNVFEISDFVAFRFLSHDGSMVLVYMLTWLGYIDGIHVAIAAPWIRHGYSWITFRQSFTRQWTTHDGMMFDPKIGAPQTIPRRMKLYMVLHGSHQQKPHIWCCIFLPAPWLRHGIVMPRCPARPRRDSGSDPGDLKRNDIFDIWLNATRPGQRWQFANLNMAI